MIDVLFSGVAVALLFAAGYWLRGRGSRRPTGTWAMAAVLLSFAFSFASYTTTVRGAAEALVPEVGRLMSNSFTLVAAASVVAFMYQLNLDPEQARGRIGLRLVFLAAALATMTALFVIEHTATTSPKPYALYVLVYTAYLGVAVKDFLQQTWQQSRHSRRSSQRVGLRIAATGCLFALLYTAYKIFGAVSIGLGRDVVPHALCSSPVTPVRCALSVSAPALAVLMITVGITLPAVAWSVSQYLRRRWEKKSFAALEPMWADITAATPDVVLESTDAPTDDSRSGDTLAFLLHRRVVEINDGILTLRPYRSRHVHEAAARSAAASPAKGTPRAEAVVEAAVIRAAVRARQAGEQPFADAAPLAPGTGSRAAGLRAETQWLVLVARAYGAGAARRRPGTEDTGAVLPDIA